jgi:hypothetical protein
MRTGTARIPPDRYSLPIGLTVSVMVHLALFAAVRFDIAVDREGANRATRYRPPTDTRLRVVDLRIAAEPLPIRSERSAAPDPIPILAEPSRAGRPASTPAPVETVSPDPISRMPRFSDPRLWAANGGTEEPVDSIEMLRERIRSGIAGYGARRGASPDAPQLGPLRYCGGSPSSPGCGLASAYPGRNREFEQRTRVFAEIGAQRDRFELDVLLRERAWAIRARAAAKRDSTRVD